MARSKSRPPELPKRLRDEIESCRSAPRLLERARIFMELVADERLPISPRAEAIYAQYAAYSDEMVEPSSDRFPHGRWERQPRPDAERERFMADCRAHERTEFARRALAGFLAAENIDLTLLEWFHESIDAGRWVAVYPETPDGWHPTDSRGPLLDPVRGGPLLDPLWGGVPTIVLGKGVDKLQVLRWRSWLMDTQGPTIAPPDPAWVTVREDAFALIDDPDPPRSRLAMAWRIHQRHCAVCKKRGRRGPPRESDRDTCGGEFRVSTIRRWLTSPALDYMWRELEARGVGKVK